MSDHDYIWLAPDCTHDQNGERLWCEDDVWDEPSCCRGQCDNKCSATEYIRMDLHLRELGADAVTIERQAAEIERLRELIDNDLTQKAFIDGYLNGGSDCELNLPRNPYSAFDEWSEEIGLSACRSKSAENDQQTGLTLTDEDKALKGGEVK